MQMKPPRGMSQSVRIPQPLFSVLNTWNIRFKFIYLTFVKQTINVLQNFVDKSRTFWKNYCLGVKIVNLFHAHDHNNWMC